MAREIRGGRGPVFQLRKCVLPAGDSAHVTVISINADLGRSAVQGHCERLGCLSRGVPPLPNPPPLQGAAEDMGTNRGLPD
eukprot:8016575-Pyramimonas_sp.AAC.1